MEGIASSEHQCPGCGRVSAKATEMPIRRHRSTRSPRRLIIGTSLFLIPALFPLWLDPATHLIFLGYHAGTGAGWIVEEVGKRFLLASVGTASAIMGVFLFTSAVRFRFHQKPGL